MKKLLIVTLCSLFAWPGFADDAQEEAVKKAIAALKEGIELLESNELEDGAEEVRWGLELIDKALEKGIEAYLIDEVGDFTGGEITRNKVVGVSITERPYTNKAGDKILVTITRQTAESEGGLFSGLNALANLGVMQGERVRYGGVTGSAMTQGSEYKVDLPLDDGSRFGAASRDVNKDAMDTFLSDYPIRELNKAVSSN